jgi:hypothetical protein
MSVAREAMHPLIVEQTARLLDEERQRAAAHHHAVGGRPRRAARRRVGRLLVAIGTALQRPSGAIGTPEVACAVPVGSRSRVARSTAFPTSDVR